MPAISEIQTTTDEVVVTERVVTNNFIVRAIQENVEYRSVVVELEVGPFVDAPGPLGPTGPTTVSRGTRRLITVWSGTEYDVVRDTWSNTELLAAIPSKL